MTGILWGVETKRIELGQRLRQARLNRGWSKEQAARKAGISSITWKRIEDGLGVQDAKRFAALRAVGISEDAEYDAIAERLRQRHSGISEEDVERLAQQIAAARIDPETRAALLQTLRDGTA